MNKELKIQCCKCLLVLNEAQLFQGLQPEILTKALQKGKAYKRAAACENRQARADRWMVCEMLKQNSRYLTPENIRAVETMSITELREGCLEYLSSVVEKI